MGRVEAVLGKECEKHVDGQKLKVDNDSFKIKLDAQELFEDQSQNVYQNNLHKTGRIFLVDTIRASKVTIFTIRINIISRYL